MESHLLGEGVGTGACARPPTSLGIPCRADRPPAHFFVKKKFIPIDGAETATQKVPGVSCYAHTFCGGGTLCYARNPPVRATAWRLHPCHAPDVPKERMGEGTAVGSEGRRWWKDSDRGTKSLPTGPVSVVVLRSRLSAVQEVPRTQGGAFFFTKKAYCVNQTACVAGGRKSVQTQPHPFSPFKSPSKITGSKGI